MEISQSQLGKLTKGSVFPGDIFRLEFTKQEGIIPKNKDNETRNKFFIVLGTTKDGGIIGFVLINTEINRNISPRMQNLHYKIKVADYPFLKKDRYICCGDLKQISTKEFFKRFQSGIVGRLKENHLEVVKNYLSLSPKVSAQALRIFGLL